jgi:His-Xaa-Ser system protein HxsD
MALLHKNCIEDNEIIVYADTSIFSKDAILKCLYWYGEKFHATVSIADVKFFRVSLIPQVGQPMELAELDLYLQKLERDIIDFNLRDIVTKETQNIRDLLIAKAFSNGEFDELPPGEITDPVGYNVML